MPMFVTRVTLELGRFMAIFVTIVTRLRAAVLSVSILADPPRQPAISYSPLRLLSHVILLNKLRLSSARCCFQQHGFGYCKRDGGYGVVCNIFATSAGAMTVMVRSATKTTVSTQ